MPGGRLAPIPGTGQSAFYTATFQQQTTGAAAPIHSEYRSQSFELNDTIKWKNLTFNVGVIASNDTLYGQGLREDSSTLSGYVSAPGNKYKMYDDPLREDDPAARGRDLGVQREGHRSSRATRSTTRPRAPFPAPPPGTAT